MNAAIRPQNETFGTIIFAFEKFPITYCRLTRLFEGGQRKFIACRHETEKKHSYSEGTEYASRAEGIHAGWQKN
jgi:hypothetical protein